MQPFIESDTEMHKQGFKCKTQCLKCQASLTEIQTPLEFAQYPSLPGLLDLKTNKRHEYKTKRAVSLSLSVS